MNPEENPIFLDLFCGAGGFSLGFERAGFKPVFALDRHQDPIDTYLENFSESNNQLLAINSEIQNIRGKSIIKKVSSIYNKNREIDIVIGGSPCQGFSIRGKNDKNDIRNYLVFQFFRIIKEIKPEMFVFENVPGIMSNKNVLIKIIELLENLRYNYRMDVLNSVDYGVPQIRRRFFIIGSRSNDRIYFPNKSDNPNYQNVFQSLNIPEAKYNSISILKKPITIIEALNDIAYQNVKNSPINYRKKPENIYQQLIRENAKKLFNHITTRHREASILIFSKLKPGQGIKDLPKKYQNNRRTLQKIIPNKPSRTITSCNEDFVHYSQNRILTIREMARLQSFPDSFVFYGTRTTGSHYRRNSCCQVQQVGNSVPPLLAQAIAEGVLSTLSLKSNKNLKEIINSFNDR